MVLGHVSTSVAVGKSPSHVWRFNVVARIPHYVVVKGHPSRFRVGESQHTVTLHHRHYLVVRRMRTYVALHAETLTPTPTVTPTPTPTVTPTPTPTPTPEGSTFNVMDYGAHHNDSADDAPAINNAIIAAHAAGGGTVYLPAGTYRFNYGSERTVGDPAMYCSIELLDNVTVRGDGVGQTIIHAYSPYGSCSAFAANAKNNFGVESLSIVMDPAVHHPAGDGDGIKLQKDTNCTFSNVYISGAYIATNCLGCQNVTYTNVKTYDTTMGFSIATNNEWAGYTNNITLTGCEASYSTQCGFRAYHSGSGSYDLSRVNNVTFNNCKAHNNTWSGFYSKWSSMCTWNGCVSSNNGSWGFYLDHSTNYRVTRCAARRNGEARFAYRNGSTARP